MQRRGPRRRRRSLRADRPAASAGRVCASAGPRRGVRGVSGAPGRVAIGGDAAAAPARGRAAARFLAGPTPRGGPAKRRAFATLVHGHARGGGRAGGDVRGAGRGHAVRRLASRVERRARNRTSPGGARAGGQQPGAAPTVAARAAAPAAPAAAATSTGPCRPAWRRRRGPAANPQADDQESPRQPASARSQARCPCAAHAHTCPSAPRLSRLPLAIRSSPWAPRQPWQQFSRSSPW